MTAPNLLNPGEVIRTSGKFVKPTKIPGKNYTKDEVVIRNADSGKGKASIIFYTDKTSSFVHGKMCIVIVRKSKDETVFDLVNQNQIVLYRIELHPVFTVFGKLSVYNDRYCLCLFSIAHFSLLLFVPSEYDNQIHKQIRTTSTPTHKKSWE